MIKKNKYKLMILAIPCIILLLYFPNINDFFLSDDFIFLFYSRFFGIWTNPWLNIRPFAIIVFGVQYSIFGLDPLGYHIVSIVLHVFNSYLVFFNIEKLTNNEKSAIIGGLMFATFPLFSEPVVWISAQFDLWMTAFILLSFFSYLKYNNQSSPKWLALSLIYFNLALFSKEISTVFLVIFICYDALFDENFNNILTESVEKAKKFKNILKYCIKYLIFLIFITIYFIFFIFYKKITLHETPYFKLANFIEFIPNSFFPFFLNNSDLYILLFVISFFTLIACFYLVFRRKNKILRFSLSWILIIIAGFAIFNLTSVDIYLFLTLLNSSAAAQGRFFYIIGVGVVIFYSTILNMLYEKKSKFKLKLKIPISRNIAFSSLILCLLIGNSILVYSQQSIWKRSSQITTNILLKTFVTVPLGTGSANIYYINVPSHVNDPLGPGWPTAYIFQNGLMEMIRIFYPNSMIYCCNMIFHKKILNYELPDWRIPLTIQEFNRISNDSSNIILYFNPITELLINVSGLNYTDFDPLLIGIPWLNYWFY